MKKQFGLLGIVLLVLASLAIMPNASAYDNSYYIDHVKVDGTTADEYGNTAVEVTRGDTVTLEVWVRGGYSGDAVDDAKVKAWIGGYEYDDIEDTSDIFEIEPGVVHKEILRLEIPEDMDVERLNDPDVENLGYYLHVKVYDDDNDDENVYTLRIREDRHDVKIEDVIFNPIDLKVEAGKMLYATVWLENIGYKIEKNVDVEISVPELGISARGKIKELATWFDEEEDDDDENIGSVDLFMKIPENAKKGNYDLNVEVIFSNGYDSNLETYTLSVDGKAAPQIKEEVTISFDTTSQTVEQGKGAVYKVSFANLGADPETFTMDVTGTQGWATVRVDPSSVTIGTDSTAEMYVYVSVNENTAIGTHFFTVNVKSNGDLVDSVNMKTEVTGKSSDGLSGFKNGLIVAGIILLIILIILGIVLAARRGSKEEDIEEPSGEGKSYY